MGNELLCNSDLPSASQIVFYFCKYTWWVSRSSCKRSPGGYQRIKSLVFAAYSPLQLSCKITLRTHGSWLLGNRNQRKGRTRICYHCPDLDESSPSCHCLVMTLQCHVLSLSWWRWSSRWLGYGPEVGSGGNSKSGPHPKERLVLSTSVFGRTDHVQWELWSISQLVVGFNYLWKEADVSFGTAFLLSALN